LRSGSPAQPAEAEPRSEDHEQHFRPRELATDTVRDAAAGFVEHREVGTNVLPQPLDVPLHGAQAADHRVSSDLSTASRSSGNVSERLKRTTNRQRRYAARRCAAATASPATGNGQPAATSP